MGKKSENIRHSLKQETSINNKKHAMLMAQEKDPSPFI